MPSAGQASRLEAISSTSMPTHAGPCLAVSGAGAPGHQTCAACPRPASQHVCLFGAAGNSPMPSQGSRFDFVTRPILSKGRSGRKNLPSLNHESTIHRINCALFSYSTPHMLFVFDLCHISFYCSKESQELSTKSLFTRPDKSNYTTLPVNSAAQFAPQ